MENVKDWLEKKGYYNSGLRTDNNHRIDLYLSDVLNEYITEQLLIQRVSQRSELLAFAKEMQNIGFNEMDDAETVVVIYIKANCG